MLSQSFFSQLPKGLKLIDESGFRLNVGIIIVNKHDQLLWARRVGMKGAWQFPQGGIHENESPEQAMYRELDEELGLQPDSVAILGQTAEWLSYLLPKQYIRHDSKPLCIGQKQKWFLLRLIVPDNKVNLRHSKKPEFDAWRWVDYWYPVEHVIAFKRDVYQQALEELAKYFSKEK